MPERSVLFVDGNNWYHSLREIGVPDLFRLDYAAISKKLSTPARTWVGTRYYIGSVPHNHPAHPAQQRFIAALQLQDSRISVHYGRLENRRQPNILADRLRDFMQRDGHALPPLAKTHLEKMLQTYGNLFGLKEKATDVMLAVDMCRMAWKDEFDTAYLLSADGDYTPAVEFTQQHGKVVFAASPAQCGALAACVRSYIRLKPDFFKGLYR
jgi:uncharacterized LabA/DUF88 family protein